MATQSASMTLAKEKTSPRLSTSTVSERDFVAFYNDLDTLLILITLKNFSSRANPLGTTEICNKVTLLLHKEGIQPNKAESESNRSISRKLNSLTHIFRILEAYETSDALPSFEEESQSEGNDYFCFYIAKFLQYALGGTIRILQKNAKGHKRYYFDPFLDSGSADMVISSIISNQYLSDNERMYLIRAISSLAPQHHRERDPVFSKEELTLDDMTERILALPGPAFVPDHHIREQYEQLTRINMLYEAITGGFRISMVHGRYQDCASSRHPVLVPIHPEKPYHLNPYAIFVSEGHQYLIATKDAETGEAHEKEKILHFRLDRIMELSFLTNKDGVTRRKRDPIPDCLSPYFDRDGIFQQSLYTRNTPTMAYSETNRLMHATLNGSKYALAVVVDAFGRENVEVIRKPLSEDAPLTYEISVTARASALERFCSQQHELITVIAPDSLSQKVRATLEASLKRYR